jgi:hypothetical protein
MRTVALLLRYWLVIVPWGLLRRARARWQPRGRPASYWRRRPEPTAGAAHPAGPAPRAGRCHRFLLRSLPHLRVRGAPPTQGTRKLAPFIYDQY